jgi:hypothetical protein
MSAEELGTLSDVSQEENKHKDDNSSESEGENAKI